MFGMFTTEKNMLLAEAQWMETQEDEVIQQWEDPGSKFAYEECKIKFNANVAIKKFKSK